VFTTGQIDTMQSRLNLHKQFYSNYIQQTEYLYPVTYSKPSVVFPPYEVRGKPVNFDSIYNSRDSIHFVKTNKLIYHENDSLLVYVTGTVKLDGGCSNSNLIWKLEKKELDSWKTVIEQQSFVLDCGVPCVKVHNKVFLVSFINNEKEYDAKANSTFTEGEYRITVYGANNKPKVSNSFYVEKDSVHAFYTTKLEYLEHDSLCIFVNGRVLLQNDCGTYLLIQIEKKHEDVWELVLDMAKRKNCGWSVHDAKNEIIFVQYINGIEGDELPKTGDPMFSSGEYRIRIYGENGHAKLSNTFNVTCKK
jgi:hypothetical protein